MVFLTKQYAIDKAKIFFRETQKSYFVIEMSPGQYEVVDKPALEESMGKGKISREAIIFSIESDED